MSQINCLIICRDDIYSAVCSLTVPLQWLHMSHIGITARVGSPVVLGILFCRVVTVDTAHLEKQF